MVLTDRDHQILSDLEHYRILTSGQIAYIHFGTGTGALGAARRRINLLAKNHLVIKTSLQLGQVGAPEIAVLRLPDAPLPVGQGGAPAVRIEYEWARGEIFARAVGPRLATQIDGPDTTGPLLDADVAWRIDMPADHQHLRWYVLRNPADVAAFQLRLPAIAEMGEGWRCSGTCRQDIAAWPFPPMSYPNLARMMDEFFGRGRLGWEEITGERPRSDGWLAHPEASLVCRAVAWTPIREQIAEERHWRVQGERFLRENRP